MGAYTRKNIAVVVTWSEMLRRVSFVLLHFITLRPESHFITCFPSPSHPFLFLHCNLDNFFLGLVLNIKFQHVVLLLIHSSTTRPFEETMLSAVSNLKMSQLKLLT